MIKGKNMCGKPKELWIVFDSLNGDRIYRSKKRAFDRWEKECARIGDNDAVASEWNQRKKPQRYVMAVRS
jgi:hypothetical protein